MYEARQNKEKVSRRIDSGGSGRVLQRMRMKYNTMISSEYINEVKNQNNKLRITQSYSAPSIKRNILRPLQFAIIEDFLPHDPLIYQFTDEDGVVWFKNKDDEGKDYWYRPGDNGKIIKWTKKYARKQIKAYNKYFENPKSIWGRNEMQLREELLDSDVFEEKLYTGNSLAFEFIAELPDSSKISIVINKGGGRHDKNKKIYTPAYYYKLEWPGYYDKIKVIDGKCYVKEAGEQYKFIDVSDGV